jgi:membrane associated rhomboid family serine protease
MIPLGDADRRPLRFPLVTVLIIVVNGLVFTLELAGGDAFIRRWVLVPADIVAGRNLIAILTSMFMHGRGWCTFWATCCSCGSLGQRSRT